MNSKITIKYSQVVESGRKCRKMFIGGYDYNIDSKGRLVIPSKFRNEIGNENNLYLTKGFDGCISIYKEDDFTKMISHYQSQSFEKEKVRQTLRIFLDSVVQLNIDSQGRILLPTKLLEVYKIKTKVHILGVLDHFEIWDFDTWEENKLMNEKDFEKNAENIFENEK